MPSYNTPDNQARPTVLVPQNDWGMLQGTGVIKTVRISSCVGVSIYDPKLQTGFLAHLDLASQPDRTLESMTEAAKAHLTSSERLHIWLGGGRMIDPAIIARNSMYSKATAETANELTRDLKAYAWGYIGKTLLDNSRVLVIENQLSSDTVPDMQSFDYSLDVSTGKQTFAVSTM